MRCLIYLGAAAALLLTAPAHAENRTFTVASAADGYGIDQCLANAAPCGSPIADAYCQGHDFSRAASFRRVDPPETTASVSNPPAAPAAEAWIAIECTR